MIETIDDIVEELFYHSSSVREYTQDFISGDMTGKKWVDSLWPKKSKTMAAAMIKDFGVKGTRTWLKRSKHAR